MNLKTSDIENSSVVGGCQVLNVNTALLVVPNGFECLAPSAMTATGKVDFPCPVRQKYAKGHNKSVYFNGSFKVVEIPYDGSFCRGCQWANWFIDDNSPLLVPYSVKSQENNYHKRKRFLVRAFSGVMCGVNKGYRFRWFVLTESDLAIEQGIDFGKEFNKFIVWLRYWCPDFAYVVVEHRQGDKRRRNWHILSYGSDKLPVLKIRQYWLKHFKSTVTGMAEVKDIRKSVYYLCKYLRGEGFVRSWCSQNWVFKGWLGVSKRYKAQYGHYPYGITIEKLSAMSKLERSYALVWLLETGYISPDDIEFKETGSKRDSSMNPLVDMVISQYGGSKVSSR